MVKCIDFIKKTFMLIIAQTKINSKWKFGFLNMIVSKKAVQNVLLRKIIV